MIYYLLYKIGQFLALSLPYSWGYWLAGKIGAVCFYLNRKARAKVLDNLKIVLGQDEEGKLKSDAKEVFVNFAKYLFEFFNLPKVDEKYIKEKIKFKNLEVVESLKDKGYIFLSAHLGNWELGAAVMAELGVKVSALALTHKYKQIDSFFRAQRQSHAVGSIPLGISIRSIFKKIKAGEVLAILGDRDFNDHGVEMDFFNKPALIPKGPAFFSIKTGCPIVCIFAIREKDNSFTFFMEGPFFPETTNLSDENIIELNRRLLKVIEKYVRQYYTQWLMVHRLWVRGEKREEII